MVEGGVLLRDRVRGNPLGEQERTQDLVGGPREHVVGAQQVELLVAAAFLRHQVLGGGDELLVRGGPGVEHVLRALLALVLHRIEEQAVVVLEHRQHRLAADRGPAAERHRDLVLEQELLGLLREQVPVRGGIHDHRLDLLAHDSALGVDLLERHHADVTERYLADGHGAGQGVQHADLDRPPTLRSQDGREADARRRTGPQRARGLEKVPPRYWRHTGLLSLRSVKWSDPSLGHCQ
jgi:hypothetical protein